MNLWNSDDCQKVVQRYLGNDNFELLNFAVRTTDNASLGLIGSAARLFIDICYLGEEKTLRFFIKSLPDNPIHLEKVSKAGCFFKEAKFYSKIQNKLMKYQNRYSVPNCYLALENKGVVLEDLSLKGFNTCDLRSLYDLEHCKVALEAIADLHASCLLYENEINSTLDKTYPDLMFVSWYAEPHDHPGNIHLQTGVKAMKAIIDVYFKDLSPQIKKDVISTMQSLPKQLRPSKAYRNCISHCDLWCNNIMFKYSSTTVDVACILDFQLFAYNPPALDVLTLLYSTTDKEFRGKHLDYLLQYYYDFLSQFIKKHNRNPLDILTLDEFLDSTVEALPTAQGLALLYLHYVLLPENELLEVMKDDFQIIKFLEQNRNEFVLKTMEKDQIYNERISAALIEIIEHTEKKLKRKR